MSSVNVPLVRKTLHLSRPEDIQKPPEPEPVAKFSDQEFNRRVAASVLVSKLATLAQIKSRNGWMV